MRWFLAFLLSLAPARAGVLYDVISVGGYGGTYAAGTGIAANGRTAGRALTAAGVDVAFGNSGLLATQAQASDVNSAGTVVGTAFDSGGPRATVWSGGVANEILGVDSYGFAINESGDVAGSRLDGGQMRAFVTRGGSATQIAVAGEWSAAYDLNTAGAATGYSLLSDGSARAFLYTPGAGVRMIGTLGGSSSYGQALNDYSQVVGASATGSGDLHAFLYDGLLRDLGTLGGTLSAAYGIDSAGRVVGYSLDSSGHSRAFLWIAGVMIDLNSLIDPASGWTLEAAYGINDAGQITGAGSWLGKAAAFRLDPGLLTTVPARSPSLLQTEPDGVTAVPEPGTLALAGIAFVLVECRRLRRRRR